MVLGKQLKFSLGILVSAVLVCVVQARSSGAPPQACKDMIPGHGSSPQESDAPFEVIPEKESISSSENVKVTLRVKANVNESNPSSEGFEGYLIIAYDATESNVEPLGVFQDPSDQNLGQTLDCDYTRNGARKQFLKAAVTHTNNGKKRTVDVMWTPPAGYVGPIIFKATFVQKGNTFWVKETSKFINVIQSQSSTEQATTLETTTPTTTTTLAATTPSASSIILASASNIALATLISIGIFQPRM